MRIDLHYGPQSLPAADHSRAENTANASSSLGEAPGLEDQAELSGAHVQAQALAAQASQLPEVREERVQSLRQAIQSGEYQADPEKIAGAMLASMISGPAA